MRIPSHLNTPLANLCTSSTPIAIMNLRKDVARMTTTQRNFAPSWTLLFPELKGYELAVSMLFCAEGGKVTRHQAVTFTW